MFGCITEFVPGINTANVLLYCHFSNLCQIATNVLFSTGAHKKTAILDESEWNQFHESLPLENEPRRRTWLIFFIRIGLQLKDILIGFEMQL